MNVIELGDTTYYFGSEDAIRMAMTRVGMSPNSSSLRRNGPYSPTYDHNTLLLFAETVIRRQKCGEDLVLKCRVGLSYLVRDYYYLMEKRKV